MTFVLVHLSHVFASTCADLQAPAASASFLFVGPEVCSPSKQDSLEARDDARMFTRVTGDQTLVDLDAQTRIQPKMKQRPSSLAWTAKLDTFGTEERVPLEEKVSPQEALHKKDSVNDKGHVYTQEVGSGDSKHEQHESLTALCATFDRYESLGSSISSQTSNPARGRTVSMRCAAHDVAVAARPSTVQVTSPCLDWTSSVCSKAQLSFPYEPATRDTLGGLHRTTHPIRIGMTQLDLVTGKVQQSASFHQQADDFYRSVISGRVGAQRMDRCGHISAYPPISSKSDFVESYPSIFSPSSLGWSVNSRPAPRASRAFGTNLASKRSFSDTRRWGIEEGLPFPSSASSVAEGRGMTFPRPGSPSSAWTNSWPYKDEHSTESMIQTSPASRPAETQVLHPPISLEKRELLRLELNQYQPKFNSKEV